MHHASTKPRAVRLLSLLLLPSLLLLLFSVSVQRQALLPGLKQHTNRRLLQSRWAAGKSISRLNALAARRIDPNAPQRITAQAGSGLPGISPVGVSTAITGRHGGQSKSSYSIQTASSNTTARTAAKDRASAVVGANRRATVRSGLDTLVMAQQQKQPRPDAHSTSSSGPRPDSASRPPAPTPDEPRLFDVLMAASSDYSVAGDRGSVILKDEVPTPGLPRRKPNSRSRYGLDYDYGPGAWTGGFADAVTAQRSALDNTTRRASAGGTTGAMTLFPGATARAHSTSSALRGLISARDAAGDFFANNLTTAVVATPPVLLQHAGADAAVVANARSYKASLRPSVAVVSTQADSAVADRGSTSSSSSGSSGGGGGKKSGASSSVFSYVAGLMTVNTQAQSAALGSCLQGSVWVPC